MSHRGRQLITKKYSTNRWIATALSIDSSTETFRRNLVVEGGDFVPFEFGDFVLESGCGVEGAEMVAVVRCGVDGDDDSADVLVAVVELQADFDWWTVSFEASSVSTEDSIISHDLPSRKITTVRDHSSTWGQIKKD